MTNIFNAPEIDERTDKAIADHAREPHELPRVGTMVDTAGEKLVVVSNAQAWATGLHLKECARWGLFPNGWTYATPEQRAKAWEGE